MKGRETSPSPYRAPNTEAMTIDIGIFLFNIYENFMSIKCYLVFDR